METVTINSQQYDSYASISQAAAYLMSIFGYDAWFLLTPDQQGQALVTATRLMDRQCWLGRRSTDSQPLEWPRTGTGVDGVTDFTVPGDIVNGTIELAFAIITGSTVLSSATPGAQTLQQIKAGSVSLTYFRGAEGVLAINRFPLAVQEYVKKYGCGAGGLVGGAKSFGTDGCSITNDDLGYSNPL